MNVFIKYRLHLQSFTVAFLFLFYLFITLKINGTATVCSKVQMQYFFLFWCICIQSRCEMVNTLWVESSRNMYNAMEQGVIVGEVCASVISTKFQTNFSFCSLFTASNVYFRWPRIPEHIPLRQQIHGYAIRIEKLFVIRKFAITLWFELKVMFAYLKGHF